MKFEIEMKVQVAQELKSRSKSHVWGCLRDFKTYLLGDLDFLFSFMFASLSLKLKRKEIFQVVKE